MARRRNTAWSEKQYGPNRWLWLNIGQVEVVVYSGNGTQDEDDPDAAEPLPTYADGLGVEPVRLHIRRMGRPPTILSLTYYTVQELEAMKSLFDKAFEVAIERSAVLDEAARKASMGGDDSIPRTWRPDAQVMERESVLTRSTPAATVEPEPDPTE